MLHGVAQCECGCDNSDPIEICTDLPTCDASTSMTVTLTGLHLAQSNDGFSTQRDLRADFTVNLVSGVILPGWFTADTSAGTNGYSAVTIYQPAGCTGTTYEDTFTPATTQWLHRCEVAENGTVQWVLRLGFRVPDSSCTIGLPPSGVFPVVWRKIATGQDDCKGSGTYELVGVGDNPPLGWALVIIDGGTVVVA